MGKGIGDAGKIESFNTLHLNYFWFFGAGEGGSPLKVKKKKIICDMGRVYIN